MTQQHDYDFNFKEEFKIYQQIGTNAVKPTMIGATIFLQNITLVTVLKTLLITFITI